MAWKMQAVKAFMPGWLLLPYLYVETGPTRTTQLLARFLEWAQAATFGYPLALLERESVRDEITRELTEPSYIHVHVRKATWSAVVPLHSCGGAGVRSSLP
jgi:hypothetical protein